MPNKNTLFVGKVVLHFTILDSTNEYALKMLAKTRPAEGTVISTFKQVAGRGQIGRSWVSEPFKNIAASLILYPSFLPARRQFLLNQAIALGTSDFLGAYLDKEVKIKWPNDIYTGSRKLAGILIQNALSGSQMVSSVAGIGINVNQLQFPPDLPNPTSLSLETGKTFELNPMIDELCHYLESRYLQLRQERVEALRSDYQERLYQQGENIIFHSPQGETFEGQIQGVDETGKLLVRKQNGLTEAFDLHTIRYR